MADPLANFRRRNSDFPPSDPGDGYVAFAAKDRVERLKIKRANKPTHAPGYGYLLDIIYDGMGSARHLKMGAAGGKKQKAKAKAESRN